MTNAADARAFLRSTLKATTRTGDDPDLAISYLQTGTLPFDVLLGGGLPYRRFTELTGAFATLKSYLALCAGRVAQINDGFMVLIDTEKSYDPTWATHVGVLPDNVLVVHPSTGEEALGIVEALLSSPDHVPDLVVWDSIAATTTAEQLDKKAGETDRVASLARFMTRMCNRLNTANQDTAILLINQERQNVGAKVWQPSVTFPGGKAAEYYSSQRIHVRKGVTRQTEEQVWRDGKLTTVKRRNGQIYTAALTKSRVKQPHGDVVFTWLEDDGRIDELGFALDHAMDLGIITVESEEYRYEPEPGTVIRAKQFWRFRRAMEASDTAVQQQLMSQVLFARCPQLVPQP